MITDPPSLIPSLFPLPTSLHRSSPLRSCSPPPKPLPLTLLSLSSPRSTSAKRTSAIRMPAERERNLTRPCLLAMARRHRTRGRGTGTLGERRGFREELAGTVANQDAAVSGARSRRGTLMRRRRAVAVVVIAVVVAATRTRRPRALRTPWWKTAIWIATVSSLLVARPNPNSMGLHLLIQLPSLHLRSMAQCPI